MSHTNYCHMACSAALDLLDELNEHTDYPWHLKDLSDSAATGLNVKAYYYQDDSRNAFAVTGSTYRDCLDEDEVVLVFVNAQARSNEAARERIVGDCRRIALFYLAMHPDIDTVRADTIVITNDAIDWRTVDWYSA